VVVSAEGVVQRDMRDARLLPEADFLAPILFGAEEVGLIRSSSVITFSHGSTSTAMRPSR
jgi:hypothetical protein